MTPAERLRKHQRALDRTQRELDRERVKLENQEKKLVQDIKKSAKNGQIGACKIQAKDLVRTRRWVSHASLAWAWTRLIAPVEQIHPEILSNAHAITSYISSHSGTAAAPLYLFLRFHTCLQFIPCRPFEAMSR